MKGKKDKYEMWFKSESRGKFVHVAYAAVHDQAGEFQGVLEYVQDIQPYREIDTDFFSWIRIRRNNELRARIYEGI